MTTRQYFSLFPSDDSSVGYVNRIQQVYEMDGEFFVGSAYFDPLTNNCISSTVDSPYCSTADIAQDHLDAIIKAACH